MGVVSDVRSALSTGYKKIFQPAKAAESNTELSPQEKIEAAIAEVEKQYPGQRSRAEIRKAAEQVYDQLYAERHPTASDVGFAEKALDAFFSSTVILAPSEAKAADPITVSVIVALVLVVLGLVGCQDYQVSAVPKPEECNGEDDDLDGEIPADELDSDGDGFRICESDCDDNDALVFPGAPELCDGIDNDCNGVIPTNDVDNDGDGYLACAECDDTDPNIYPGATELCNGVDDDCDGIVPAGEVDSDGDGFLACEDCDDANSSVYPGAMEDPCNGIDDDCDGISETDVDGDGYYAECDDCDDEDDNVYPGAVEIPDCIDNDCDGDVDEEAEISLSLADVIFEGENFADEAGISLDIAGDVNGDGYDDVLIGASLNDDGGFAAGKAYLVYGGGLSGTYLLASADVSFIGENAGDYAGWSISSAGDVNGDGYDDILIGAYGNDDGGSNAGKVYLLYGGGLSGSYGLALSPVSFIGAGEDDLAGRSVLISGDVNNDGYFDILTYSSLNYAGAYLYYGGELTGTYDLGMSDVIFQVGGASNLSYGDINDDNYDDILLGDAYGTVLIYGADELSGIYDVSLSDASFLNEYTCCHVTLSSTSLLGDIDNDGYDDVLIGDNSNEEGGDNAGKAHVMYGGGLSGEYDFDVDPSDVSFVGESDYDYAGRSVSSAGDINGDGNDDVLVGTWGADETYLMYGGGLVGDYELAHADVTFVGSYLNLSGWAVSLAGDVNGDGYDDILIGSPSTSPGNAYLFYGWSCE